MMDFKPKNKKPYGDNSLRHLDNAMGGASSATEATGIIPAGGHTNYNERAAYDEVFGYRAKLKKEDGDAAADGFEYDDEDYCDF